ncbi:MAG: thioredoxin domain-containing protein [Myxococcota bacterium]
MRRSIFALTLFVPLACDGSPTASAAAPKDAPAAVEPPVVPSSAVPVAAKAKATAVGEDPCSAAAFALPSGTVVGTVDGEPIRASALGDDAREAEREALHTYCSDVAKIRQSAAQRAVESHLLARAARKAGVSNEDFVRAKLDETVGRPDDAELEAFYDANKTADAPPFEAVKGQVEQAVIEERSKIAYDELITSLRKGTEITLNLPDVRPPPYDLTAAEHTATFGSPDAKVRIVEFSDFECPYCSRAATAVTAVKKHFGDKVEFAYRHFPLSFHPSAQPAAEMSQCAHEQGKFWPLHDEIFANQAQLGPERLRTMAQDVGLDMAKLDECLASGRVRSQVEADLAKGREVGVRGTPSFYINGRSYAGGISGEELIEAINQELAGS